MQDADIGHAVRDLIGAWLAWHEEIDRRERGAELVDRVDGYRIVTGGQVDSEGSWEINDAETGEVLACGVGVESYEAAWQESWAHIDRIRTDAQWATPRPDGDFRLPKGLADALRDWVIDRPDEAEQLISG